MLLKKRKILKKKNTELQKKRRLAHPVKNTFFGFFIGGFKRAGRSYENKPTHIIPNQRATGANQRFKCEYVL